MAAPVGSFSGNMKAHRIFAESEHPFVDRPLEHFEMPPQKVREMRPRARRALVRAQKKAEQSTITKAMRKKKEEETSKASSPVEA